MIDQIKSIQAKLENVVADIALLSQEVGKIENRDKVSLELEKKLNEKSLNLSIKEEKFKEKLNQLDKDREELSRFSETLNKRQSLIFKQENDIKKLYEDLEIAKKEIIKRE